MAAAGVDKRDDFATGKAEQDFDSPAGQVLAWSRRQRHGSTAEAWSRR